MAQLPPVYSTQFVSQRVAAGVHDYTVPAGQVAIVRCVNVVCYPVTTTQTVWVGTLNTLPFLFVYQGINADYINEVWNGRWVLNAGEGLRCNATFQADFLVSGYLLTVN